MNSTRTHRRSTIALIAAAITVSISGVTASAQSTEPAPAERSAHQLLRKADRGAITVISDPAYPEMQTVTIGSSVVGRPIVAMHRKGSLEANRTIVAVGVIHGDERHGRLVTDRLVTAALPADLDLWIVPSMNPDGEAVGHHQNARGVDLNRNFPASWQSGTHFSSGRYFSGSGPGSEPETQTMMSFLESLHPDVTIWFHAPWNRVDCDVARVGPTCTDYAQRVGSYTSFAPRPGTATDWLLSQALGVSFIHEFGAGTPSSGTVDRHVAAVLALGA